MMFNSERAAFIGGMRAVAPVLLGALPFGLVLGVISAENHLTPLQMLGFSLYIFAGVSQLVALQLYAAEASLWVIVLSAVMVNLRLVIYSASIAKYFKSLSSGWKWLISYWLTDQAYAFSIAYYDAYPDAPHKQWYYTGVGTLIWVVWMAAVIVGYFAGAVIPASWSLNFVIPIMFLGLLVPAIKGFPYLAAAIVSATIAVLGVGLPHNLGLVTAIVCGLVTGALLEREP